jgi:hypothetical protein
MRLPKCLAVLVLLRVTCYRSIVMKIIPSLFTLILFTFLAIPAAYSGATLDDGAATVPAPATVMPAFTEADCEKKIAALTEKYDSLCAAKDQRIDELEAELKTSQDLVMTLKSQLADAQSSIAALEIQITDLQSTEPEPEVTEPSASYAWVPWIIAIVLAVVGFLIGRSTSGSESDNS